VAVVIAYAIALHMDWERPYWAAWTAFSIGLATRGEGLHKGLNRLAGGLVGAISGFVLLAFFIQDRWLFMTFLSLYAVIFTYLALGSKRNNYLRPLLSSWTISCSNHCSILIWQASPRSVILCGTLQCDPGTLGATATGAFSVHSGDCLTAYKSEHALDSRL
jgi:hypothetical protein